MRSQLSEKHKPGSNNLSFENQIVRRRGAIKSLWYIPLNPLAADSKALSCARRPPQFKFHLSAVLYSSLVLRFRLIYLWKL